MAEQNTSARKKLVRDVKREALERMEAAARTTADFEKVLYQWNHLDENRERRERYWEKHRTEPLLAWNASPDNAIIPPPFGHAFWRQLPRFEKSLPLTLAQREFLINYLDGKRKKSGSP